MLAFLALVVGFAAGWFLGRRTKEKDGWKPLHGKADRKLGK